MGVSTSPRGRNGKEGGGLKPAVLAGEKVEHDFNLPFQYRFTLPKLTDITAPQEVVMPLPIGMIRRLWVEMPEGCAGLVGLQVWRRVYQIFPLPEGQWYVSDNTTVNFAFSHSVHNEPYEVTLRAYNLDDTYRHQPWIAFEMTGLRKDLSPQLQQFFDLFQGQ